MSENINLFLLDEFLEVIEKEIPEEERDSFFKYYQNYLNPQFEHPPVDFETFLFDEYFIGKVGRSIWPVIVDDLMEFLLEPYVEALITGGTRSGKSFFTSIVIVWLIYLLSCYKYPQDAGELARSSHIYLINLSITGKQAEKGIFAEVSGILSESPYFNEEFRFDPKIKSEYRFPKRITYFHGNSQRVSAVGLNIFGGCLDEITSFKIMKESRDNRAELGQEFDKAHSVWEALYRRAKDTFTIRGVFPGRLVALGSREFPNDWMERRIKEYSGESSTFIREYKQYETKPARVFTGEFFYVDTGAIGANPRIVLDTEIAKGYEAKGKLEKIPVEFKLAFERDIYGALRDISGIVTRPNDNVLFTDPQKIFDAYSRPESDHPFNLESTTLIDGLRIIKDKLIDSEGKVRISPNAVRYLHVDQSHTTDMTGIAMGHVKGWTKITRLQNGDMIEEIAPLIHIDFMLSVIPPEGGHIETSEIRNLIYQIKELGFHLRCSFDFVGIESMYKVRKHGIPAIQLSVDREIDPYMSYYDAVIEGRFDGYFYPIAIKEATNFLVKITVNGRQKIDHIPSGSKDVSDAIAAVCYRCSKEGAVMPTGPIKKKPEAYKADPDLERTKKKYVNWLR